MDQNVVRWRAHFDAPPARVFAMFATDEGRRGFWVETSRERDGAMTLTFPGEAEPLTCRVVRSDPPRRFAFEYFGGTLVEVTLADDGSGGTDLSLLESGFPTPEHREENLAGWVSVLMNLKAVVDHGTDLRNRHPGRTWTGGYCEC